MSLHGKTAENWLTQNRLVEASRKILQHLLICFCYKCVWNSYPCWSFHPLHRKLLSVVTDHAGAAERNWKEKPYSCNWVLYESVLTMCFSTYWNVRDLTVQTFVSIISPANVFRTIIAACVDAIPPVSSGSAASSVKAAWVFKGMLMWCGWVVLKMCWGGGSGLKGPGCFYPLKSASEPYCWKRHANGLS